MLKNTKAKRVKNALVLFIALSAVPLSFPFSKDGLSPAAQAAQTAQSSQNTTRIQTKAATTAQTRRVSRPSSRGARVPSRNSSSQASVKVPQSLLTPPTPSTSELLPEERANIFVYEKCNRAVVNIQAAATPEDIYFNIMPREGMGSGAVISEDGYIVTNDHVVGEGSAVRVTFFDESTKLARVVGRDPSNDIAVLKAEVSPGEKLHYIRIGTSNNLQVGRKVLAIGNPFGFDRTMTEGIVSSLGRTIETGNGRLIKGIIQTDAAINPGNSGGPLLNMKGELIGINTAIFSRSGQSSGIGFTIPASIISRIVPELIEHHIVRRADTGILALQNTTAGLRVLKLDPSGPAAQAGVQGPRFVIYQAGPMAYRVFDPTLADIITHIDNIQVKIPDDFLSYVEKKKPNQVVTLTVLRGGRLLKIPVKLTVTRTE